MPTGVAVLDNELVDVMEDVLVGGLDAVLTADVVEDAVICMELVMVAETFMVRVGKMVRVAG